MRTSQAEMMLRHPLCDYNNITSTTLAWLLSLYQGIYWQVSRGWELVGVRHVSNVWLSSWVSKQVVSSLQLPVSMVFEEKQPNFLFQVKKISLKPVYNVVSKLLSTRTTSWNIAYMSARSRIEPREGMSSLDDCGRRSRAIICVFPRIIEHYHTQARSATTAIWCFNTGFVVIHCLNNVLTNRIQWQMPLEDSQNYQRERLVSSV